MRGLTLALVRQWLVLPASLAAAAAVLAGVVSLLVTPVYRATSGITVRSVPPASSTDTLSLDQFMQTQAALVPQPAVLDQVVKDLHLPYSWQDLQQHVMAVHRPSAALVDVSVEDSDPARAAGIANAVAADFVAVSGQAEQRRSAPMLDSLKAQADELEHLAASEAKEMATIRGTASPSAEQQGRLLFLQQQYPVDMQRAAAAQKVYDDARMAAAQRASNFVLAQQALPPTYRVRPNTRQNIVVGGLLGILVGAAAVWAQRRMGRSD